ncbi:hypothetical protein OEZ85_004510 [Tetradesmus obliquus]|uniref:TauD/TfdA-like domain-containing protein n=1 Tax=Tetradesmus obliquus TaxID=3088 RepID=A0ABY8UP74_TETOB|nr:hypothetical protein OEZ85_004510 [Tetradesmus obliquus]
MMLGKPAAALRFTPHAQASRSRPFALKAVMAPAASDISYDQAAGPLPAITPPELPPQVRDSSQLKVTRQGSVEPYTLVEGPEAWYGRDYQHNIDQWAITLSETHIAELDAAIERVLANKTITQEGNYLHLINSVTKEDFPLETLGPILKEVQQEVLRGRGFALLRGLPVERWSRQQTLIAYWGIGLHWGNLRRQNEKAHLIGHVKDVGVDSKHQNPTTRIYLTSVAQPWHVDGTDVVGLLCLKTAKAGGKSSLASSVTIHNELLKRDAEIVKTLAGTWYMDRKNEVPEGKLPYYVLPVVHYHQGYLATSFNDTYYQLAATPGRHPGVPPLTDAQVKALAAYREVADSVALDFWLQPGDLQLVHNHTQVHNRSAYEDYEDVDQRRHLLRLWIAPSAEDGAFPLHDSFAELWHSTQPGNRGGIYIEGYTETIPLEAEVGNKLAT